ncbi:MAG: RsbRD N-terminal domain-containing protein [Desulfovibrio sp.]|nr:RsbRD N-terminal domain-containing protein [Desulfovibrio sp.]
MDADNETLSASAAGMLLSTLLSPKKDAMATQWIAIVHGTYPFDTTGFLRTRRDRFANPVGHRTEEAAKLLVDALFADRLDEDSLRSAVDELIRVRAVQDFSPEIAVGVIFALKDIVRRMVGDSGRTAEVMPALLMLESRIDAVALMAFGAYARFRETLHMMKVDEFKRLNSQLLRLAEHSAAKANETDANN